MFEMRGIHNYPLNKRGSMRTATIIIQVIGGADSDIEIPVHDFSGMFIDAIDSNIVVSYVDSVIYRRLLVLLLAKFLPSKGFKIIRRYITTTYRNEASIVIDNRFNDNIQAQIQWAIDFPDPAFKELTQVSALLQFDEGHVKKENSDAHLEQ